MKDLVVLGASTAVVVFMVVVAALLGFRTRAQIDAAGLQSLLSASDPGARVAESAIAADGRAAVARLADGRVLIAKSMGDRVTLRAYPASAVSLKLLAGKVRVAFADLGFPTLNMKLNDPPRWLTELAAGGGGNA